MKNLLIRSAASLMGLLWLCMAPITMAQEKINPPPSAQLDYSIRAVIQGLSLNGSGTIDWVVSSSTYRLQFDTRTTLTGALLSERSEGVIERQGLQPAIFYSKRFRKEPVSVSFDREGGSINFPGNHPSLNIEGKEQDRISVLWQLLAMARATPQRFSAGSPWNFFVIGHRGGEPWTFTVQGKQRLHTALGEFDSLHLVHLPPQSSNAPKVDIWLAPSLEWFPVRIRISESNGDSIEQTIEKIQKK